MAQAVEHLTTTRRQILKQLAAAPLIAAAPIPALAGLMPVEQVAYHMAGLESTFRAHYGPCAVLSNIYCWVSMDDLKRFEGGAETAKLFVPGGMLEGAA